MFTLNLAFSNTLLSSLCWSMLNHLYWHFLQWISGGDKFCFCFVQVPLVFTDLNVSLTLFFLVCFLTRVSLWFLPLFLYRYHFSCFFKIFYLWFFCSLNVSRCCDFVIYPTWCFLQASRGFIWNCLSLILESPLPLLFPLSIFSFFLYTSSFSCLLKLSHSSCIFCLFSFFVLFAFWFMKFLLFCLQDNSVFFGCVQYTHGPIKDNLHFCYGVLIPSMSLRFLLRISISVLNYPSIFLHIIFFSIRTLVVIKHKIF